MTFIEGAKLVLTQKGNIPMSPSEIWTECIKLKIVKTGGKTPSASMRTILMCQSINSPIKHTRAKPIKNGGSNREIFEIVEKNPMKFKLINYLPSNIKSILSENGFITLDMLKDILSKNNINIEI